MMDNKDNKKDLSKYYLNIGNEFDSKWKQLSHILGDSHYPSVGNHVESLLRNAISKFLPSQYSIGTGFVLFPKKEACAITHTVSKQLDIIVYKNTDTAPIYQDGQFVVVTPESIVAIIEVKSAFSSHDLKSIVDLYQDYCEKHLAYLNDFFIQRLESPVFFSYSIKKEKGSPSLKTAITKLKECLINCIEYLEFTSKSNNTFYNCFSIRKLFSPHMRSAPPVFGGCYVYNKYEIIPDDFYKDNTEKSIISLGGLNGRNDEKMDITFVHMLLRMMDYCNIPYNGATLSAERPNSLSCLEIRDIYNVSEMKIMY